MTDRELMQQALDALEWCYDVTEWPANGDSAQDKAIEALRARLAQPEPEPVDKAGSPCKEFWDWLPKAYRDGDKGEDAKFTKYNMEVAYLAGKQSQPKQEPVAWMGIDIEGTPNKFRLNQFGTGIPLYTAPPQREWQGLTDQEQLEIMKQFGPGQRGLFADAIEAKLKEKNNG